MNCRVPTEMNWRVKWNLALSKIKCSNGSTTCIRHFSSNDLILKNNKYCLKPMAVPKVFDSDKISLSPNDDANIINDVCESINILNTFDAGDETLDDDRPILNECSCNLMKQTIEMQLESKRKNQLQAEEMMKFLRLNKF